MRQTHSSEDIASPTFLSLLQQQSAIDEASQEATGSPRVAPPKKSRCSAGLDEPLLAHIVEDPVHIADWPLRSSHVNRQNEVVPRSARNTSHDRSAALH